MTNFIPVVTYARTNTTNSDGSFCGSIKKQNQTMKKWAKSHKYHVIGRYKDECASGYRNVPNDLLRLINDIKKTKMEIKYLIVCQNNRISRDPIIISWFYNELKIKGVEVIDIAEVYAKEDNNLSIGIKELMTKNFINRHSKASTYQLNEIAKQGLFTGGRPPFGYQSVTIVIQQFGRDKERKVLSLHPKNAKIVKKIFKLYLSEESGSPFDPHKIALYLNENNILKDGKKWTTLSVKKIIKSTLYQGQREYGRNRSRSDFCNEIIVISIPPIITKNDFEHAQNELTKRSK